MLQGRASCSVQTIFRTKLPVRSSEYCRSNGGKLVTGIAITQAVIVMSLMRGHQLRVVIASVVIVSGGR
jgi:hypothetical protein